MGLRIDDPVDEFKEIHDRARLPRTLLGGTDAMRKAGIEFLPRWPKEDAEAWTARKDSAFLFGAYLAVWSALVGRVFRSPIGVGDDVPDALKPWIEDFDGAGNHLDIFARNMFGDSLHPGYGLIITDYPVSKAPLTIAEENRLGYRPYARYVPAECILDLERTRIGGREMVTHARLLEDTQERDGWGRKTVRRVRVYDHPDLAEPPQFQLYVKPEKDDGKEWPIEAEGIIRNVSHLPIAEFRPTDSGRPFLDALADRCHALWQTGSDLRAAEHMACVTAFTADFPEDVLKVSGFGNGTVFHIPPERHFQILKMEGSGAEVGGKAVERLKEEIQALSLEPLMERASGQTATAKMIDQDRSDSALGGAVRGMGDALELTLGFMAEFSRLGTDGGGSLAMPKDFGIGAEVSGELAEMLNARRAREISRRTWLEYLKAHHLEDLNVDDEMEALDSESGPALGATGRLRGSLRAALQGLGLSPEDIETRIDAAMAGAEG